MQPALHTRLRPTPPAAAAIASLLCVAACTQYEPRPIDVSRHAEAFLERTPERPDAVAFATAITAPPAEHVTGESASIGPARAEVVALIFNADLRRVRAAAGVAQATAEHAGLWQDPVVGITYTDVVESVASPSEVFGNVSFSIPISGRLEIEKERLGQAHAAALAEAAELEWTVRIEVRRAWIEWTAALRSQEAAAQFTAQLDGVLEPIRAMERLGELTRVEARLFQLERVKAQGRMAQLDAQAKAARLRIDRLLGLPPEARVAYVPSTLTDAILPPEGLERLLLERNPTIVAAKAQFEVAELALEENIRAQIPDIGLSPGYGTENDLTQFNLGIYLPIPIFNGNRQGIAVAQAQREVARTAVERSIEDLLARCAAARIEVGAAVQQRELVEGQLLPLADTQYAELRELARLGEVDPLVLLDGISQQFEAKLGVIDARRMESTASIALAGLIGPPPTVTAEGPTP